jgi:hypothetical protein
MDRDQKHDLPSRSGAEQTRNWINLVAGLTHSIGNEVRAIHDETSSMLDIIDKMPHPPEPLWEQTRFIQDINRVRLGFINFLEEFAECLKSGQGRRPIPQNLKEIPLDEFLPAIRDKVGRFECRNLDPDDPNHQVQLQLNKHLELPMVIQFDPPDQTTLRSGRIPVLEFVAYEFIKNALRNCSGKQALKIVVETRGEWVSILFINDLNIHEKLPPPGKPGLGCSQCRKIVPKVFHVGNSDFSDTFCEPCLRVQIDENLGRSWEPGHTSQGGKGLGLFVIRHFLETFYFGRTHCGVTQWKDHEVYFKITIPSDLAAAIGRHNARFDTRPTTPLTRPPR